MSAECRDSGDSAPMRRCRHFGAVDFDFFPLPHLRPVCRSHSQSLHAPARRSALSAAEIRLRARRFRCVDKQCATRIFTERSPGSVSTTARRTDRLSTEQTAIGFTAGGEPGGRLSQRLAMPVSGDTLLRMVRSSAHEPFPALRVVGIDRPGARGSVAARLSAIWSATAFLTCFPNEMLMS